MRYAPVPLRSGELVQTPGGFARGGTVFRGLQPSGARLRRAERGSAERSEAPPSEARPREAAREAHREVAITKKLKKVPPESPGEPLILVATHTKIKNAKLEMR